MPLSVLLSTPSTLDFPGMAFQALSSSTTLTPFHTCREWSQPSTHNTQRSHQRRPYHLLVRAPLVVRCPPGPKVAPLLPDQPSLLWRKGRPPALSQESFKEEAWKCAGRPLAASVGRLASLALCYLWDYSHLTLPCSVGWGAISVSGSDTEP